MTVINTYLYPNVIRVQILDTTIFTTGERRMYARPITIYQGIDNPLQVVVRNQDQKPVNLTGYTMQADIQDPVNRVTIQSMAVNFANIALGRGNFTINRELANSLEQRIHKLTFRTNRTLDNQEQPMYVDDNYGVPLDLYVKPAYYSDMPVSDETADTVLIDGGTI